MISTETLGVASVRTCKIRFDFSTPWAFLYSAFLFFPTTRRSSAQLRWCL